MPRVAALLSLVLLAPSIAAADGFADALDPEALSRHLDADASRVLVVRAGTADPLLDEAAAAVAEALRAGKRASLVMDDVALGGPLALSDAEIVARASWAPVDRLAIVRVFPGAPPQAVVTLVRKDGTVVASLSAARGGGVAQAAEVEPAPETAPVPDPGPSEEELEEARAFYAERFVGFEEGVTVTIYRSGFTSTSEWRRPYQGRYRKPLDGAKFYEVVGRKDLASDYRARTAVRWSSGILGTGLLVGAAWVYVEGIVKDETYPPAVPISLGVAGAAGLLLSTFLDPHPVEPYEARAIADRYNTRLREDLGLLEEP